MGTILNLLPVLSGSTSLGSAVSAVASTPYEEATAIHASRFLMAAQSGRLLAPVLRPHVATALPTLPVFLQAALMAKQTFVFAKDDSTPSFHVVSTPSGSEKDRILTSIELIYGKTFAESVKDLTTEALAQLNTWSVTTGNDFRQQITFSPNSVAGFLEIIHRFGIESATTTLEDLSNEKTQRIDLLLEAWNIILKNLNTNETPQGIQKLFASMKRNPKFKFRIGFIFQVMMTASLLQEGFGLHAVEAHLILPSSARLPRYTSKGIYIFTPWINGFFDEDLAITNPKTGEIISVEIKSALRYPMELVDPNTTTDAAKRYDIINHNQVLLQSVLAMKALEESRQRQQSMLAVVGNKGITKRTVQIFMGMHPKLIIRSDVGSQTPFYFRYETRTLGGKVKIFKMRVTKANGREKLEEMFDPEMVGDRLQL
ncbi:MAG: hypothetical protein Q7T03_06510 [Deltaproteobacteria bacterium]|nr:hypothetical protein [Deltaproteobacteria bacterium]